MREGWGEERGGGGGPLMSRFSRWNCVNDRQPLIARATTAAQEVASAPTLRLTAARRLRPPLRRRRTSNEDYCADKDDPGDTSISLRCVSAAHPLLACFMWWNQRLRASVRVFFLRASVRLFFFPFFSFHLSQLCV